MPYGLKVAHHIDWVIHHLKAKLKQLLFYSQHLYQWCFWAKYLRTGLLEEIWFPPWLCCFLMLDEDDQVSKICFLLKVIKKTVCKKVCNCAICFSVSTWSHLRSSDLQTQDIMCVVHVKLVSCWDPSLTRPL